MEQESLLQAIRTNPDDRTARLVYADWLDEHGDAVLAEYVRVALGAEASSPGSPEVKTALTRMLDAVRRAGRSLGGWEHGPILDSIRRRLRRERSAATVRPPARTGTGS